MTRRVLAGSALIAVLLIAAAGGAFWYYFVRDNAPERVSLSGALESLSPTAAAGTPPVGSTPTQTASAPTSLAGTWSVADATDSFVGYRVKEELAQIGFTTAVGRTSGVSGTFVIEANSVTSGNITAQLSALRSDRSQRDNALRQQALETGRYPTATFELTSPVSVPGSALKGERFSAALQGKLTLHGVTRDVSIPVEAQLTGNLLVVVGSIEIVFADYNIAQPRAQAVLSIEDHGTMELQLFFTKS